MSNPDPLAVDSQFDGHVETIEVRAMRPRLIESIVNELCAVARITIERNARGDYWLSTFPNRMAPLWWYDTADTLDGVLVKARAHAVRNGLIKE